MAPRSTALKPSRTFSSVGQANISTWNACQATLLNSIRVPNARAAATAPSNQNPAEPTSKHYSEAELHSATPFPPARKLHHFLGCSSHLPPEKRSAAHDSAPC